MNTTTKNTNSVGYKTILVAVVLFIFALFSKFISNNYYHPELQEHLIGSIDGKPKKYMSYDMPTRHTVLNLVADALLSLGCSLVISVFIIRKIEDSLADERKEELKKISDERTAELNKLQNQVRENVILSTFGILVDSKILEVFKRDVIDKGTLRRNARWTYDFSKLPNGDMLLQQGYSYNIYSVKDVDQIECLKASYDNVIGQPALKSFIAKRDNHIVMEFNGTGLITDSNDPRKSSTQNGDITVIVGEDGRTEVCIMLKIRKKEKMSISFLYETKYTLMPINDSFFSPVPLVNAELEANFPPGYEFSLFSCFSSDLKPEPIVQDCKRVYKAKGGILPNQGFIFSLKSLSS